jgi:hypothetical protein
MLMLFSDQHVMVLSADDRELGMGEWSDELDDLARANHGYAVVINSDPPVIYADYRSLTMVTDGGYKVQTVSTVDKGQSFRVTGPHGFEVLLQPWKARHSLPIRTMDQLIEVLEREGEDYSTLKEEEK